MGKFKRIYKQNYVVSVLQRFKDTYKDDINKSLDLKKPISVDSINKIIKNESWTSFKCDFCGKDHDLLIQMTLNNGVEYNSESICICSDCIEKIYSLSKEKSFIQFLKDNDAYDKYMHNILIENQRWDEIYEYIELEELKQLRPDSWLIEAFYWGRQQEDREQWYNLHEKWKKLLKQNSDVNIVWE